MSIQKRRPLWKKRRFWVGLIAILCAILLALWLISGLEVMKEPPE